MDILKSIIVKYYYTIQIHYYYFDYLHCAGSDSLIWCCHWWWFIWLIGIGAFAQANPSVEKCRASLLRVEVQDFNLLRLSLSCLLPPMPMCQTKYHLTRGQSLAHRMRWMRRVRTSAQHASRFLEAKTRTWDDSSIHCIWYLVCVCLRYMFEILGWWKITWLNMES